MAKLTLYKDSCVDFTVVSNLFIDQYMGNANDAQLKVYLYLIRMLNAGKVTSVSDIADKFNHTEKDVMRSLKYWEKQGLLALEYDQGKNLVGIHVNSLSRDPAKELPTVQSKPIILSSETMSPFVPEVAVSASERESVTITPNVTPNPYAKPAYTASQLKEFKNREDTRELIMVAEKYFSRPLTPSEMQTLMFFSDTLHFSVDLVITLLEYCIDRGKKDFKYIERVAVGWAEEGITTPEEAQRSSGKYSKNVYVVMNELGKNGSPTSKELEFINRWIKDYGFSLDIILEACQRTVLATDRHRFEYCDSILTSWNKDGVTQSSDIVRMDELHQKKKASAKQQSRTASTSKFNQFGQNEYDFDVLTQKLISN